MSRIDWNVLHTEVCSSTNTDLKRLAEAGAPDGTVLTALRQTDGRGRGDHRFFSPDTGLYLSFLLRGANLPKDGFLLTVTAAVAARNAVRCVCGAETKIKWVNDLYLADKKVCGILSEGAVDPETGRLSYAVCGVGFNLFAPEGGFPEPIRKTAGYLCESRDGTLRDRLCAEFLSQVGALLSQPFPSVLDEYRNASYLTGKSVVSPQGAFLGSALVEGIDERGGLILRTDSGCITLNWGEVSVKTV